MKTSFIMITALIALSHNALAQTSSATAPAAAANTSTSSDSTASAANKPKLGIKYLGVMYGPSADFSGAHTTDAFGNPDGVNGNDFFIDNRPKLVVKMNPNLDIAYEARVNTFFEGKDNGVTARNGNHRLGANFKGVYKDEINTLSINPRIDLPTSRSAHNKDMLPSPELIVNLDTAPKDSRFSFNSGVQYIQLLYGRNASAANQQKAVTAVLAPWAEVDYQATPKLAINLSYWPEMVAQARKGTPLATDSNEVDFGITYEVAKGWQLAPFVATQFLGLDAPGMSLDKATNINLALTGAFL